MSTKATWFDNRRGFICLKAQFQKTPAKQQDGAVLTVGVIEARQLGYGSHSNPDPYVKLYLSENGKDIKTTKQKTEPHKGTTNPVYEERFEYPLPAKYSKQSRLQVTVWDHGGKLSTNDCLGGTSFSFDEIAQAGADGIAGWFVLFPEAEGRTMHLSVPEPPMETGLPRTAYTTCDGPPMSKAMTPPLSRKLRTAWGSSARVGPRPTTTLNVGPAALAALRLRQLADDDSSHACIPGYLEDSEEAAVKASALKAVMDLRDTQSTSRNSSASLATLEFDASEATNREGSGVLPQWASRLNISATPDGLRPYASEDTLESTQEQYRPRNSLLNQSVVSSPTLASDIAHLVLSDHQDRFAAYSSTTHIDPRKKSGKTLDTLSRACHVEGPTAVSQTPAPVTAAAFVTAVTAATAATAATAVPAVTDCQSKVPANFHLDPVPISIDLAEALDGKPGESGIVELAALQLASLQPPSLDVPPRSLELIILEPTTIEPVARALSCDGADLGEQYSCLAAAELDDVFCLQHQSTQTVGTGFDEQVTCLQATELQLRHELDEARQLGLRREETMEELRKLVDVLQGQLDEHREQHVIDTDALTERGEQICSLQSDLQIVRSEKSSLQIELANAQTRIAQLQLEQQQLPQQQPERQPSTAATHTTTDDGACCSLKTENEALLLTVTKLSAKLADHKSDYEEENRELRACIDRLSRQLFALDPDTLDRAFVPQY